MRNEHEPIRRSTWRTSLRAFEVARDTALADPTLANRLLAYRIGEILIEELMRPGKFELGQIVATPGALAAMEAAGHIPPEFLLRHKNGDWGSVPEEDARENERALRDGDRLFSAYPTQQQETLWVITEADRSATTMLLPDEY
jgi:hypothetical protein